MYKGMMKVIQSMHYMCQIQILGTMLKIPRVVALVLSFTESGKSTSHFNESPNNCYEEMKRNNTMVLTTYKSTGYSHVPRIVPYIHQIQKVGYSKSISSLLISPLSTDTR